MLIVSILAFYVAVAFFALARYYILANRLYGYLKTQEVEVKAMDYMKPAIKDSLSWPWYVFWFGLKQWIEDLT
jgi:hypothetical protein